MGGNWKMNTDLAAGVELADAVIRIAHLCGAVDIDLEARIVEKLAYNATRPYKHGRAF